VEGFSKAYFSGCCAILPHTRLIIIRLIIIMIFSFPRFPSRKKTAKSTRQEENVFIEASELAQLRLEQCIADLRAWLPTMNAKRDGRRAAAS
jgi:hypothetical protein